MPAGASAALAIGGSIAKGVIGSGAANAGSKAVNQAAQQGNQILQGVENQSTSNLQPFVNYGQQGSGALAGLLGIGGNPAQSQEAFNNYLGSTNYQFLLGQGENAVKTAGAPSFNSGATAKALNNYAQGMAGNALQGYEGQLNILGNQGIQSGIGLGTLGNQNAIAQSGNLMNAAGVTANEDLNAAGAQGGAITNALQGVSGVAGGVSPASSLLSSLFGGQQTSSSFGSGGGGALGGFSGYNPNTAPSGSGTIFG